MHKDLFVAKILANNLKKDNSNILFEHGLDWVFEPIRELNLDVEIYNTIVCAIIYSYHPDSNKVDLRHDSEHINKFILLSLKANIELDIYKEFIQLSNDKINEAKGNYLDTLSADWQFITARRAIDVHTQTMKMPNDFTNLKEEEKILKAKTELSKLTRDVILQRKTADELIDKLKKDKMITDERVKQDFGLSFIEENIKRDNFLWRNFIKYEFPKLKKMKLTKNQI